MESKKITPLPVTPAGMAKPKAILPAYTFRTQGWPYIRKAGLTFGIIFVLSALLVGAGRYMLLKAMPATVAALERQTAAQMRLEQAETERLEIRDFQPKFEQLRARGFVGPENRLAMVEAIQQIQKKRKLMPIAFSFAPQQLVAVDPALLEAPLELHSTGIRLRMDMLHEMDLVHFFQDLKERGTFSVKDCLVNSLGEVPLQSQAARLTVECTVYSLSVGEAAPVDPAPVQVAP